MFDMPSPPEKAASVEVLRGPNIKPFPRGSALPEKISAKCILKVGDNITTDHIMPAGAKILPYRSNIPYLSQFCFTRCDADFPERAKKEGGGFIVGGTNYGQGSSREHAALVPLYLGVKAVIAKSFARIHFANLVNNGILPLVFADPADCDAISQGDELELRDIRAVVTAGGGDAELFDRTSGRSFKVRCDISHRQRGILLAGGLINLTASENR
jgi:aconitate hydratase